MDWYKLIQVMAHVIELSGKPAAPTFCYRHRDPRSVPTGTQSAYPYAMEVLLFEDASNTSIWR